jgi:hypothetical protein
MTPHEYEEAVAAFIRARGVTRCPTACVLPTQATPSAADRRALEQHALAREMRRENRLSLRFGTALPDVA